MLEMLMKALGFTPEMVTAHIDEFRTLAHDFLARVENIEKMVSTFDTRMTALETRLEIPTTENETCLPQIPLRPPQ